MKKEKIVIRIVLFLLTLSLWAIPTYAAETEYKYKDSGNENIGINGIDVSSLVGSGMPSQKGNEVHFPQADGTTKVLKIKTSNNEKGEGEISELKGFSYDPVTQTVSIHASWRYYDNWHVDDVKFSYGYSNSTQYDYQETVETTVSSKPMEGNEKVKMLGEYKNGEWVNTILQVSPQFGKEADFLGKNLIKFGNDNSSVIKVEGYTTGGKLINYDGSFNFDIGKHDDGTLFINVSWMEPNIEQLVFSVGELNSTTGNFEKYEDGYVYEYKVQTTASNISQLNTEGDKYLAGGKGSYENPYQIVVKNVGDVCVIKYQGKPEFHFYVPNPGSVENIDRNQEGTFLVNLDTAKKEVRFKLISSKLDVGYIVDSGQTVEEIENNFQVGANPVNLSQDGIGKTSETTPAYLITEIEGGTYGFARGTIDLKNAFNYTSTVASSLEQHEASFVFVYRSKHQIETGDIPIETDVVYQFAEQIPSEQAGLLEKLCTRLFIFLGDMFLKLIKLFLGTDLTIDKIIFNQYEPTVLDLRER